MQKAWDAFGRIDALMNNAGVRGSVNSPLDWTEDEWHSNLSTNLTGSWLVSKYVCKLMRDAKIKGCVINISSITGIERGQLPGGLGYTASKTGLNAITKVMALELGVYGIRVNSISPGLFKSEITSGLMQKDWLERVMKKTVPLRSYGTLDPALTSLVRFLIHDSSDYVTGNIFIVDAGAPIAGSAVDKIEQVVGYVSLGYPFGWTASILFGRHHEPILRSQKPKLFIMGTKDGFTTVKQLQNKLKSASGRAETHLLEGVGHFQMEGPAYDAQMVDLIIQFIQSLQS